MKDKARWFWLAVRLLVMGSVLQIAVPAIAASHWEAQPALYVEPGGSTPPWRHVTAAKDGWVYTIEGSTIFRWSIMTGWESVATVETDPNDNAFSIPINAATISGNSLYFGGLFESVTTASGWTVLATNIARLDLNSLIAYPIGNGIISNYSGLSSLSGNNYVMSITVDAHTNVYAALNVENYRPPPILQSNPTPIVICTSNGTWVELGEGMNLLGLNMDYRTYEIAGVFGLANDGTNIFACGKFLGGYNSNGAYVPSGGIIKWDGTNWQTMGGKSTVQMTSVGGIFDPVIADATFLADAVAVSGTNVFVTGNFVGYPCIPPGTPQPDCPSNEWSSVGPNLARFSTSGTLLETNILQLKGQTLSANIGFDLAVQPNGTVYLAGQFDKIDNTSVQGIAQRSINSGWTQLDTVNGDLRTSDGTVGVSLHLAVDSNNAVYVLGGFSRVGNVPVQVPPDDDDVARWVTGSEPDHVPIITTVVDPSAGLNAPIGITFDVGDHLWIADTGNQDIVEDVGGTLSTILDTTTSGLSTPLGIALDPGYDIFVADGDWGGLLEFVNWPDFPDYSIGPKAALSVARSSSGKLYCVDEYGNTISKKTAGPRTSSTVVAGGGTGGDNGPATSAKLSVDSWFFINSGLNVITASATVDSQTNLYIADMGNYVVRKVANTNNYIYLLAGNYTQGYSGDSNVATSAQLTSPAGVVVDTNGNVYIADAGTNVIRKVDLTGTITTVAGTGQPGYTGDGGPAINATLNTPTGLALDSAGNLYISDTGNNVIRKVTFNP